VSAIKYKPDEDTLRNFEAWLDERPQIRELVNAAPPWHCYRIKDHPGGHYSIHSYNDAGTLTLIHGADSFLPGVSTFGHKPESLVVCDCGTYEWATDQQSEATNAFLDQVAKERREAN
jgi:hypothetical protein